MPREVHRVTSNDLATMFEFSHMAINRYHNGQIGILRRLAGKEAAIQ